MRQIRAVAQVLRGGIAAMFSGVAGVRIKGGILNVKEITAGSKG